MTILEFWGCTLIAFGPAFAMFCLTVAHDPIKVILLISSSFFWLISFLVVAICWAIINTFCDYLIIGALLAVLSQESFRYLFHFATKKAQLYLDKIINNNNTNSSNVDNISNNNHNRSIKASSSRAANEIQYNNSNISTNIHERMSISYVSGLGFGLMNGAFSLMNVLTDYVGPGTVGIKGDSTYFLLVSALTCLAFILLNVSWSILMSESIEKSDNRLMSIVIVSHLVATTVTFLNRSHLQLISLMIIYSLTLLCGAGSFQASGFDLRRMLCDFNRRPSL